MIQETLLEGLRPKFHNKHPLQRALCHDENKHLEGNKPQYHKQHEKKEDSMADATDCVQ